MKNILLFTLMILLASALLAEFMPFNPEHSYLSLDTNFLNIQKRVWQKYTIKKLYTIKKKEKMLEETWNDY